MPDKSLIIEFKTASDTGGAERMETAIRDVGSAATRTANTFEQVSHTSVQKFAEKGEVAAKSTRNMGSAMTAVSYQMQDFTVQVGGGTSAVTAFAQQAPQLIGGLQMAGVLTGGVAAAMSGLAVAIPLVAFGGKALFNWMAEEKAKSAGDSQEYLDGYLKMATKVYADAEAAGAKSRTEAAKGHADELKRQLTGIDVRHNIAGAQADLQKTRETNAEQMQLSQQRLELARLESSISVASGNDLLRLSKEREASLLRILETENNISEIARNAAIEKAASGVSAAGEKVDALKQTDVPLVSSYEALAAEVAGFRKKADDLLSERSGIIAMHQKDIDAYQEEIDRIRQSSINAAGQSVPGVRNQMIIDDLQTKIDGLTRVIGDRMNMNGKQIDDLNAKAASKQPQLDEAKAQLEKSAAAQADAARAMGEATRALSNLRQSQASTRQAEASQARDKQAASTEITDAAKRAIDAIRQDAASRGEKIETGGFSGRSARGDAIEQIERMLKDATPDAEQGNRLAEIMRSFQNSLQTKDDTIYGSIQQLISVATTQASQYEAVKNRIQTLEERVNQQR